MNFEFDIKGLSDKALLAINYLCGKLPRDIKRACKELKNEINVIKERDPAARSSLEVLLLYSGLHALLSYRVAHAFYKKKMFSTARAISQIARFFTGIEIHPGAKIGRGLFIDHGAGVVIGETAEIGDNCTIYQGVTLGGTGKDTGKRHPTLGDNVMVGAGAKVLGPFKVGSGSKIAANAVVLEEIPEDSTAVGIPARVVRHKGAKVNDCDLDQVHIPDPVAQQICQLRQEILRLERRLAQLEGQESAPGEKVKRKSPVKEPKIDKEPAKDPDAERPDDN